LLDGGIIKRLGFMIPDEDADTFYAKYQSSIRDEHVLFVNEMADHSKAAPPVWDFDMYFDMDQKVHLESAIYQQIVHVISRDQQDILKTIVYDEDADLECAVATAGVSQTVHKQTKIPLIKIGLHNFFPHIHSTPTLNLIVRKALLVGFKQRHPNGWLNLGNGYDSVKLYNSWEDVIDKKQIENSMCRMLYSNKLDSCNCKSDGKECEHAQTRQKVGKVDKAKQYRLFTILPAHPPVCDQDRDDLRRRIARLQRPDKIAELLKYVSIRNTKPIEEATPLKIDETYGRDILVDEPDINLDKSESYGIPVTGKTVQTIIDLIRLTFRDDQVVPDSIRFSTERKQGMWFTAQSALMFCWNKEGYHSSRNQWYKITPFHIERRCWSRKEDIQEYRCGKCSDFVMKADLTTAASKFLFSKDRHFPRQTAELDTLFPKKEGSASAVHRALVTHQAALMASNSLTVKVSDEEIIEEEAVETIASLVKAYSSQKRKAEAQKKSASAGKKSKSRSN
jgi:hypothetical protein